MAARRTVTTRTTQRESKVTSRMTNGEPADAPPPPETGGLGYADAIVLVTTVLLIAAFVMADCILGKHFGKGMFFK